MIEVDEISAERTATLFYMGLCRETLESSTLTHSFDDHQVKGICLALDMIFCRILDGQHVKLYEARTNRQDAPEVGL